MLAVHFTWKRECSYMLTSDKSKAFPACELTTRDVYDVAELCMKAKRKN